MHTLRLLWAAHNEEVWLRRQNRHLSRRALEQISEMPEQTFIERFRLNKDSFMKLCQELRSNTSLRGTKEIPLEVKILCALSFLATGSYQRIVGVTQHLPQRTASRCIRQVVDALNNKNIVDMYIQFPQTPNERSRIRQEFQRRCNLPGVLGCIDCTHIAIVKPRINEHLFFNRKGYHSLNVQMICDYNLKIMNVNPKYGGATHNSFIWSSSQVEPLMRKLHQNGEQTWLLGNSGYPQKPWLMTPVVNAPLNSREHIYTIRHVQARNCVERCFSLLKARWKCLLKQQTLHYDPIVSSKIVVACCILHNIALLAGVPRPIDTPLQEDDRDYFEVESNSSRTSQGDLMLGRAMLSRLINSI